MPQRGTYYRNKEMYGVGPIAVTAVQSATFDTAGFESIFVTIQSGVVTDGTYATTLTDSDDNVTFAANPNINVDGPLPAFAATDDNVVKAFGIRDCKRYVKVTFTPTGTTTGGLFSITGILSHARHGGTH